MNQCPKCGYSPNTKKNKFLDCVYLTPDECTKLIEKFGKTYTDTAIEKLNNYLMSRGKQFKYKSHYHTILTWERNNGSDGNSVAEQKAEKFIDLLKDRSNRFMPEMGRDMEDAFRRMGQKWAVLQEKVVSMPYRIKEQFMKAYMGETIYPDRIKEASGER